MNRLQAIFIALLIGITACVAHAAEGPGEAVAQMQTQWADINYQSESKARTQAFAALVETAQQYRANYPNDAGVLIWNGIIKSSYAGAAGGLKALGLAKKARADLEQAMALDRHALQGSALTSLGTLYFKVPGWPVGFGDEDKARALLSEALSVNPQGIDPNYFYGDYLLEQHQYAEARRYFDRALAAPARPERAAADAGRRAEIQAAMIEVNQHLGAD